MKVNTLTLNNLGYPTCLKHITGPPKQLFWIGMEPRSWLDKPKVAIVGSRKISAYGKEVTYRMSQELAKSGVVIISGLAYGVDATAHQAAVEAGGTAVAILPTSLAKIVPVSNQHLAQKIVENGGTLLSEYASGDEVYKTNFVARNRIVSGLCDILLITEAAVNSGSLHTARFALEQGKTVMAIPGNITSPTSEGCNNLIKSGAVPVTDAQDIFFVLNINPVQAREERIFHGTPEEEKVLEVIKQGIITQEEIAQASSLDGAKTSSVLTMLEISGQIRPQGAGIWTIS